MNRVLETIVFMQGDDAEEVLALLYPDRSDGSTGFPDGTDAALEYLAQWDSGEPGEGFFYRETDPRKHETEHYVMTWDYALTWVALDRKPTAPEHWEEAADEFDARPLPLYF